MSVSASFVLAAALLAHEKPAMEALRLEQPASDVLGAAAALLQDAAPVKNANGDDNVAPEPKASGMSAANNPLADEMNDRLDASVSKGLARLARMQNADGSWSDTNFGRSVAVTALACLAMMADGNVPGRGAYGEHVERGLEYILKNCSESGLIATDAASSPMYGHGFATLFLGEIYGMTAGGGDTDLSNRTYAALSRAVRLIETTQNDEGGWRYNPVPNDADVSVTICQVMALRSARNAGIKVPRETIDAAINYILRCQNDDGGFRYMTALGQSAWPRSAAGVASLFYAGVYEGDSITRGLSYIARSDGTNAGGPMGTPHFHYGAYYTAQTMYLAGGSWWRSCSSALASTT